MTTKKNVSADEFVRAWIANESIADVAKSLNMAEGSVRHRAYQLRLRGVQLPHKKNIDVKALNELIAARAKDQEGR